MVLKQAVSDKRLAVNKHDLIASEAVA